MLQKKSSLFHLLRRSYLISVFCGLSSLCLAQEIINVNGTVISSVDDAPLIGASVRLKGGGGCGTIIRKIFYKS